MSSTGVPPVAYVLLSSRRQQETVPAYSRHRAPARGKGLSPPPPLPVPSPGAPPPHPRQGRCAPWTPARPERPRPQTPDGLKEAGRGGRGHGLRPVLKRRMG
ncbi:hypothetical protein FNV66_22525 [Streptomyces sp. S1D4-14]|nr:hypothetical protein FNV66_22525 [Streptomyces sp. S1D4-14]